MGTEVTSIVGEKDGALEVKGADGVVLRYVKESDLLAVKGGRDTFKTEAETAKSAHAAAVAEATGKIEAEHQKALAAEARASSLEDKIKESGGSAAELAQAKSALEAAKKSSEELGNKHLELRRQVIVATYGVPKKTVESKDLTQLDVYEEALKAVMGDKAIGNFAVGGGGGGANALQGKAPMDLARDAYSSSNRK